MADVNKLVDEMITKVGDGVTCVDHLKLLIEKEHEAILKKDISELQKATEMKTRGMDVLSESLEAAFNLIKKIRGELIETEVPHSGEMTLTSLIDEALQSLQNHNHRGDELTQKVYWLKEKTLELITVVRNVQPLIQKNQLVVNGFLENYRQSLSFWEQIKLDQSSSYSEKGMKKPQPTVNHFVAKV